MKRRAFMPSLCALPLAGCQDGSESLRFRVIAMVMYQGNKYEASTVMECHYTRVTNSLVGHGGSFGILSDEDLAKIKSASGRKPFSFFGHLPTIIAFCDETQPKTLFEIQPDKMEQTFPGVKFIGLDIEVTDAPVTTKLRERLPWLDSGRGLTVPDIFPRDPPGHRRRDRDVPIAYKLLMHTFSGTGADNDRDPTGHNVGSFVFGCV